jgi:hypothetical protein
MSTLPAEVRGDDDGPLLAAGQPVMWWPGYPVCRPGTCSGIQRMSCIKVLGI